MVANLVIVLLLLSIYYAYTNHNREFTATASAIQQIWSGTCRLSCRQSEYSGFSGLSGLVTGQNTESTYSTTLRNGSAVCVCESCPCELVENVLRTCSPATNIYTRTIEFVSDCYYDLVKTLVDFFNYIDQVMRCNVSCQRQPQMLSLSRYNSVGNMSFVPTKDENENEKIAKIVPKPTTTPFTFTKKAETIDQKYEPTSSRASETTAPSLVTSDTTVPAKSSADSQQTQSNCSRCIEKGKTCMGSCPRMKKN
ncbi:uncharacterized protein LOC124535332 [Vanessa cardui]|uniref:uncharacterized protein LOC124535332 n=1 Tax=Vanessa cardui TaxID=171605 RepID=UPI001F1392DE|nr:uncharacterized protein LOC124535332 [Vanessa cardui]